FEDGSGDAELAFDRLVGVGVAAERDWAADISFLAQLGGEQLCRLRLVEEGALEMRAGRESEEGVARPRVAIDAAVLAAAIGVDRAVEADVRRVVSGDDRARRIDAEGRPQRHRLFIGRTPAVVECDALFSLEASALVARGTASLALPEGCRHIHVPHDALAPRTIQEQIRRRPDTVDNATGPSPSR